MPSKSRTREGAPDACSSPLDEHPDEAPASSAHALVDGEAHALASVALAEDPALALVFWRARAEELAARVARLEQRLVALGERLPSRWARLLTCDAAAMPDVAVWPDPLAGWRETTALEEARVATTLPRLWQRLDRDAG
jgi:hypothetical protein